METNPVVNMKCDGNIKPLRWSQERADSWYSSLPWLFGCNYIPAYATNQIEMWHESSFSIKDIDRELSWAAGLGMNTIRVFLHDLLWNNEGSRFLSRVDQFLEAAAKRGIRVIFVLFDSCWHPFPHYGPQPIPEPGVHNSRWLQSPGLHVLRCPNKFEALKDYVQSVLSIFRDDDRVLAWDLWNEPDNSNSGSYGGRDISMEEKAELVAPLVIEVFSWARKIDPSQPLTMGVWLPHGLKDERTIALRHAILEGSDFCSFHNYCNLDDFRGEVKALSALHRPMICTEFLNRISGNTFQAILPFLRESNIGAYCWGLVAGKSQTYFPHHSWQFPCADEPALWFHDILRNDGSAYDPDEVKTLKRLVS